MNSEDSKTSKPSRPLLHIAHKIDLKIIDMK